MSNNPQQSAFAVYWKTYGGIWAILRSPYFWISVVVTAVCYPLWNQESDDQRIWTNAAVEIIPSLMAFSLGAMAILLAFSNEKLMRAIQKEGEPLSMFMKAAASLFHFLLLQSISLILVLISQAYTYDVISAFGFFFMIYGILVAVATSGILLQMARIFNATAGIKDNSKK